MKILGNLTRGLLSHQKHLLYKLCILSIAFYRFSLWFFNKAPLLYSLTELRKIQYKATIWITSAFCTSPILGVKAITGLISIHLHLWKLSNRHQIRTAILPSNHVINTILKSRHFKNASPYCFSLENITFKQWLKIKSSIVDTNNHLNGIFPFFDSLNSKFSPQFRLIDKFPNCVSFHQANCKDKKSKAAHLYNIFFNTSLDPKSIIVVLDASVRNNIAMSISYVHSSPNDVRKTIHHAINVISTKAKLCYQIWCRPSYPNIRSHLYHCHYGCYSCSWMHLWFLLNIQ